MAPVLLTERLRLDGFRAGDLEPLAAMWQRPEVFRHIGDRRPRSRSEVWKALTGSVGQWDLFGYGGWAVRERETGAIRGTIGLMDAKRDLEPSLDAPEALWMLAPEAQGRGLAREGLAAMLGWADAAGIARIQCIVDPDNAASIALAERLGFRAITPRRFVGDLPHGDLVLTFERPAGASC